MISMIQQHNVQIPHSPWVDDAFNASQCHVHLGIYANSRITITTSSLHFMRQVLQATCKRRPQELSTPNLMHNVAFGCSLRMYMAVPANIWASEMFESHTACSSAHFLKLL